MLKLDEEPRQASAAVRWGRARVLAVPLASAVVRLDPALVMEAPGWSRLLGVMCTPAQEFPDLAGLQTHEASLIPEAPSILGAPMILVTLIDRNMERRVPGPRRWW